MEQELIDNISSERVSRTCCYRLKHRITDFNKHMVLPLFTHKIIEEAKGDRKTLRALEDSIASAKRQRRFQERS